MIFVLRQKQTTWIYFTCLLVNDDNLNFKTWQSALNWKIPPHLRRPCDYTSARFDLVIVNNRLQIVEFYPILKVYFKKLNLKCIIYKLKIYRENNRCISPNLNESFAIRINVPIRQWRSRDLSKEGSKQDKWFQVK